MRKFICTLLVLNAITALAYSHPPTDIKMGYDSGDKVLTVSVVHNTKDPMSHYIDDIEVFFKGILIVTQRFDSQTDKEKQSVKYVVINVKPGDEFNVIADCNIRGKLEKKLVVGDLMKSKKMP